MSSAHLWFGGVVAFCWLAPPTVAFSHGGSPASCQEMIPGHIQAHPLDLGHSSVTVHTSASSYLPGQLITVTVRSSRDFMGFLLQARGSAGPGPGPGPRPGTHTLRCLSEGDTITHSDKQPKRNLSFVWRAPDVPVGDVRFIITVVQSYFIYWAGVESSAVHDGSRSVWSSGQIPAVDGGSIIYTDQEGGVTAPPGRKCFLNRKISAVHQNPKPFPNHKPSHDQEAKPKPKRPSNPPRTPDREGKYPDIIPRHSSWELGMLLGCSAGLGMVLVVGLRYMFRQACGRRTEVTLSDREREYGRGPIQVQECGDLVRVRKIRENSFVLLTEYDVLAPIGSEKSI
uniref:Reeler domain containing 1 n=1 Tax=Kryptolebias marmoratus TaxID=37003 RepID=A0A3Q2ZSB0_KRYMA